VSDRSPIRVCMLTAAIPLGGAETLQLEVLAGIDREAFRTEVLCLREAGQMAPRFEAAGVPVSVMGRSRWQHLLTVPALAAWLRERRIDVVLLTPHHAAMFLGPPAARLGGVCGTALGLHQIGGKGIGIPSLPPGGIELMCMIDVLVLLSRAQLDYLRAEEGLGSRPWRRVRHAIIPNGVRVGAPPTADDERRARAALGLAPDHLVIGCVAALRREKNHELLLGAAARLAPRHPRLRVVLLGSGDREEELRAAAAARGLGDRVMFTGFRADIPDLLPALDVKALTSVQETYPVSVLEAMAAARPVVMTDPPGVPPIVLDGETGYLVPVGDEEALADRLDRLLSDVALRRAMGERGHERARREFGIEGTLRRYEELFRRLARRNSAILSTTSLTSRN
jgi:glycosyltransferase involved in cell wall biosynthesis